MCTTPCPLLCPAVFTAFVTALEEDPAKYRAGLSVWMGGRVGATVNAAPDGRKLLLPHCSTAVMLQWCHCCQVPGLFGARSMVQAGRLT